ncbi:MAG: hypothetical protein V4729_10610 [Pseudomonadota bacterium]
MKHVTILALSAAALAGCSSKPPGCDDAAALAELQQAVQAEIATLVPAARTPLLRDMAEGSQGAVVEGKYEDPVTLLSAATPAAIAGRVSLKIANIRTAGFDKDVGKYSCEADADSSVASPAGSVAQKLSLKYSVQLNADKKLHVGLVAPEPAPLKALVDAAVQNEANAAVQNEANAAAERVARAASLCKASESIVMSCRAGTRTLSVCASPDLSPTKGYLEYRAARHGQLEITLPSERQHPAQTVRAGSFQFGMGEGNYLRFSNGGTDYLPYAAVGKYGDTVRGVTVESNGNAIAHVECGASALDMDSLDAEVLQTRHGIPADTREFMP